MTALITRAQINVFGIQSTPTIEWRMRHNENTFECRVVVCREADGFSAHAAALPGVISQGDTVSEAIENIREALEGAIQLYRQDGGIPWTDHVVDGEIECEKRILVNA